MTTGSSCRRNNRGKTFTRKSNSALVVDEGVPLFVRRRLPRIGNDLIELRHGEDARHPELADDKGRRALEAKGHGLIAVAGENRVDRLGVGDKVAVEAVHVDSRPNKQLPKARLRQL